MEVCKLRLFRSTLPRMVGGQSRSEEVSVVSSLAHPTVPWPDDELLCSEKLLSTLGNWSEARCVRCGKQSSMIPLGVATYAATTSNRYYVACGRVLPSVFLCRQKPWLRTIDEIWDASIAMIILIPHDTALTSLQVLRAITGDYFLCNIDTYRLELPQGYQICDKNSQHKRADTFTAHKGARIPCVDPGCFGAQMVHLVLEQLISLVRSCEIGVKDCLWSKHTAVVRLVIIEVHFVVEV